MPDRLDRLGRPAAPMPGDLTTNLPFAWQVRTFPYGLQYQNTDGTRPSGRLLHGYMASAALSDYPGQIAPTIPQFRYQLHFLYNPSTLTVSHSAQAASSPLPPYLRPDSGIPMVGTGGNLSLNLLYDRTYEVNEPGHPAYDRGVLLDVAVLYGLVGITTPLSPQSATTSTSSAWNHLFDQLSSRGEGALNEALARQDVTGVMQMNPVWLTLGTPLNPREFGLLSSAIEVGKYFGFVNNIQVAVTHWTQNMVPDRCGIQIGMTLMANNGFSVPIS
ncbi:hypothetical protein ACFVGM_08865 [Kitasatospora purpeofusca]|uniref:hypothetical protein n=1 Tax=Kitasatospora purpeofusca TaxID=67352 RepID=UPI003686705F